jgi:hypothetical protein
VLPEGDGFTWSELLKPDWFGIMYQGKRDGFIGKSVSKITITVQRLLIIYNKYEFTETLLPQREGTHFGI